MTRLAVLAIGFFVVACQPVPELGFSSKVTPNSIGDQELEGVVRHWTSGEPVSEVVVMWQESNVFARTDEQGRFRLPSRDGARYLVLEGPTVVKTTVPASEEIYIWSRTPDREAISQLLWSRPPLDGDDLADPDLTDSARSYLAKQRFEQAPTVETDLASGDIWTLKQDESPPSTIRVYRRGDENNSCEGIVEVLDLEEYVRGVVPNEWIASWHEESLRAGAIAARSYGWGWILAGGKYDCADVDDTTRSQVYSESRNSRTDAAVLSTIGMGIFDPTVGAVIRSEYSAENANPTAFGVCEPLCEGETIFGHGRGMCQWGTQRWATEIIDEATRAAMAQCDIAAEPPRGDQGQTAEWMVSHYFPGMFVTGQEQMDGTPRLLLSQSLSRIDEFDCLEPGSGFGCADFVPDGESRGIFDLFEGQQMSLAFNLVNDGNQELGGVEWKMSVPAGIEVEGVMTSGQVSQVGNEITILFSTLPDLGEETIVLILRGGGSLGRQRIESYVSRVDSLYQKNGWNSIPILNEGFSFNGGDLRLLTEIDVFAALRWDFVASASMSPLGWRTQEGEVSIRADGVMVTDPSGLSTLDSPYLYPSRGGGDVIFLRADSRATLSVRYTDSDQFDVIGSGVGTNAFVLERPSSVVQLRVEGPSPLLMTSVVARQSVNTGAGEGVLTTDVGFLSEDAASVASSSIDAGMRSDSGPNEAQPPIALRYTGSCMSSHLPQRSLMMVLLLFSLLRSRIGLRQTF